ncbi:MAG: hypothetical protein D6786_09245 [Gammaproteobacteria bacterium]|nr:MAG: hypothetical protein D6786_09245 [Gammaproteobacteria bacterium]
MNRWHRTALHFVLAITAMVLAGNLQARQFRQLAPIATPRQAATLPEGAVPVATVRAVPRNRVETLLRGVLAKWNTGQMAQTLSPEFFDRTRLLDAVDGLAPRDATLRLLSLQGVQTLQQYELDGKQVSIVSATARTQLEFNSPASGFVRRQGVNEFILKITSPAGPTP